MGKQKNIEPSKFFRAKGFALVSFLLFLPLFLTLMLSLGAALYIFKRKSLTQSLCAQTAASLQSDLKLELDRLLNLNVQARRLQMRRQAAERALSFALASKNPTAIAFAEASLKAVRLAQMHLRARQMFILQSAEQTRARKERLWRAQMANLKTWNLQSFRNFVLPLAVYPQPLLSDSPEYLPLPRFSFFQQQSFSYWTDLTPPFFSSFLSLPRTHQKAWCAASIIEKEGKWIIDLHAANAPSRSW